MRDIFRTPPSSGIGAARICHADGVSESSSAATDRRPMPTSARVAVALLALLAVLLLANAALTWFAQDVLVDRLAAEPGADRAAVAQQLLLFLIAYAIMGLSALLAAVFLPRRHLWARMVGVLVMSLLAVVTLFSIVTTGGVSAYWLLALVASVAAVTSLVSGQTTAWLRGSAAPED